MNITADIYLCCKLNNVETKLTGVPPHCFAIDIITYNVGMLFVIYPVLFELYCHFDVDVIVIVVSYYSI